METTQAEPAHAEVRCAECGTLLPEGQDREVAESKVFCRFCFESLTAQIREAVAAQGRDIPYPLAALGGILGGAVGVLVWWGFTVTTGIAFGLVAIVIGFAVGKGVTMLSGGKRALGLQILSVVITLFAFGYASYLVTRSFVIQSFQESGQEIVVPLLPDPELFFKVLRAGFGGMEIVFLGIALYQAWKLPAPAKLKV